MVSLLLLLHSAAILAGSPSAASPAASAAASGGRIAFSFEPAAPVKGRDAEVVVRLEVRDAAGKPLPLAAPPRVVVSTGTLGPLRAGDGPGRFEGRWTPSSAPQPEVLGLVAVAPGCERCATALASGGARLPISAAIELPGRSDPGVATTVEIAGHAWGPVKADAEGRFLLPAVVPPGARYGQATSRNRLGNEKRKRLDLHLDDRPGLLCALWPERLTADGKAEAGLTCIAWTASGRSLDSALLRATAVRGAVESAGPAGDGWSARYRAPAGGTAPDRITVALSPSGAASTTLTLPLAPGPPASIEWAVEGEPLVPGGEVPVRARALDAYGTFLGDATADDGSIEGGRLRVRPTYGDGRQRLTLRYTPPPAQPPDDAALAPPGSISRDVEVALRPPGTFDVVATLEGKWLRWRVLGPDGAAVRERKVSVAADGVELGPVEPDGDGGRCALRGGKGTVSVTDDASGATALLEVR